MRASGTARSTTWRYTIEPTESGCRVTESFDSPILDGEFFQKINRHDLLLKNIVQTLDNLKAVVEGPTLGLRDACVRWPCTDRRSPTDA
ncbi:MAG: hypothetical protein OEV40_23560 [Acidimicrobiia bacterium]|nr:hypothetical protein [Acidimicrobiia bacterium]